jgi:hypothetical protein
LSLRVQTSRYTALKEACNENQGGSGRWHTFAECLRPLFDFCLILQSSIISNLHSTVFPFPPSKSKLIGDRGEQKKTLKG